MTAARRGARPVGGVPPPTHVRARAGVASGRDGRRRAGRRVRADRRDR
ncbi:unnamed protein product [Burkholderia pseudomallei]|nr:hypothetical protein UKMR15_4386 [Burkholderia pseudomallei]VUD60109.1 unnamed protein product [Burkholderia pseudomallei]